MKRSMVFRQHIHRLKVVAGIVSITVAAQTLTGCVCCHDRPGLVCKKVGIARPGSQAPFDLVSNPNADGDSKTDYNGVPRNPVWYGQTSQTKAADGGHPFSYMNPQDPKYKCFDKNADVFTNEACSTQGARIFCDVPKFPQNWFNAGICGIGGIFSPMVGHTNWEAATYEGNIHWQNEGTFKGTDRDSDLLLYTQSHGGLTSGNCDSALNGGFGVEFDSGEIENSINTTRDKTFFWQAYADKTRGLFEVTSAAEGLQASRPKSVLDDINGKYAIVTGVLGLDFEHGGHAELHPVYALAIHLKDGEAAADGAVEDVWLMLVRNWGNEGFCSTRRKENVLLDGDHFTFDLPGRAVAKSVASRNLDNIPFDLGDCSKDKANCSRYLAVRGEPSRPRIVYYDGGSGGKPKVFVTFTLPASAVKGFVVAELHLRWQGVASNQIDPKPAGPDPECQRLALTGAVRPKRETAEERMQRLLSQMPKENARAFQSRLEASQARPQPPPDDTSPFPKASDEPLPVKPGTPPSIDPTPGPDPEDLTKDDLVGKGLCEQYDIAKKNDPKAAAVFRAEGLDKVCKKKPKT